MTKSDLMVNHIINNYKKSLVETTSL